MSPSSLHVIGRGRPASGELNCTPYLDWLSKLVPGDIVDVVILSNIPGETVVVRSQIKGPPFMGYPLFGGACIGVKGFRGRVNFDLVRPPGEWFSSRVVSVMAIDSITLLDGTRKDP